MSEYLKPLYENLRGHTRTADADDKFINRPDERVSTISDLIAVANTNAFESPATKTVQVLGYYSEGDGGGGLFYWDGNESKSNHNGGTIIDPDHTSTIGSSSWYSSQNSSDGCWKRQNTENINTKHFGAKVDGSSDDTLPIQNYINYFGSLKLPSGTSIITDTILIDTSTTGSIYKGEGKEKSFIEAQGLSGKDSFQLDDQTAIFRTHFKDFGIKGDARHAININTSNYIYRSSFQNLYLKSNDDAFFAGETFTTYLLGVIGISTNGHSFNLKGGNTFQLLNCYAVEAGTGKAGYKIEGNASLYDCNGIDNGEIWGEFGISNSTSASIVMMGCNVENFSQTGIKVNYQGELDVRKTKFGLGGQNSIDSMIEFPSTIGSGINFTFLNNRVNISSSDTNYPRVVISGQTQPFNSVITNDIDGFHDIGNSINISLPRIKADYNNFATYSLNLDNLKVDRDWSFNLQSQRVISDGSGSFDATDETIFKTNNSTSTTLQTASGGKEGQELKILIQDSNTTIEHNDGSNGSFVLSSGTNETASNGDMYLFVFNNNKWRQV